MAKSLRAVLFDLDGTLLDTAPDMIAALNCLRREAGLSIIDFDALRSSVSHGSARLIQIGFPDADAVEALALQRRFLTLYRENLSVGTRLFPGMDRVLDEIRARGLHAGIITNKPAWLTLPLLEQLNLSSKFGCVVSGDTLPERKPHPLPLLHAARLVDSPPSRCVYIGDAQRDIEAARAAGMHSLIARYGYIGADDDTDSWAGDGDLAEPLDLLAWLRTHDGDEHIS